MVKGGKIRNCGKLGIKISNGIILEEEIKEKESLISKEKESLILK